MIERIRKGVRLRTINEAPSATKRDPKKIAVKRLGKPKLRVGRRLREFAS